MSSGISRIQRFRYRLRGGVPGHRRNGTQPVPGSSFWYGVCQCGWAERTISPGAARGALEEHLRSALPWVVNDPKPFVGDVVEEELAQASNTLRLICERPGSTPELVAARDRVAVALENYRTRLTQV